MIDLRTDTLTRPTDAMRARDGRRRGRRRRVRRGPDRPRAARSGSPACSARRPRCSRRPGRWPTCSRCASLVGAGQEVLCEARAHIARAELGAHGGVHRADHAHLVAPARPGRPAPPIEEMYAPDMGPFFVRTDGDLGREHPQLRRRRGAPARRTCRRCGPGPTRVGLRASTSTAPGSGTRTSPPAPRSRSTARSPTCSRSACPRGSARRSARWSSGTPDAIDEARVLAQADGRRHAPGRRARRGRAARARPPRRAAGRRPRARPAARRGVRRRPGHRGHQHRRRRRARRAGPGRRGRASRACVSAPSAPAACAWSPTSTSAGTTRSVRRRCSRRCCNADPGLPSAPP